MLTSTFIHAQGVGLATERRIWEQGILHWREFLSDPDRVKLTASQRAILLDTVGTSVESLNGRDHLFFARYLPAKEHWRAYDEFGANAAFVDIETTGMGLESHITVIGLYDGREMKQFIRGINLEDFELEAERYPMLVTFFGTNFDLPRIRYHFRGLRLDQLHVDLCFAMRRLGLTGGLKRVEVALGLDRDPETKGLDGWDAVRLWWEYENGGSRDALQLLLKYNEEDVVHLKTLMDYTYAELRGRCLGAMESGEWGGGRPVARSRT